MFIHSVYFWLKPALSAQDHQTFLEGIASLTEIETVAHGYWGKPAATDRPIIEKGYSYGLVLVFKDQEAHDAYQVDPVHDLFRERCSPFWNRVTIFDTVQEA
ncbi:Dabb family protein [Deinococcus cellulosilyticus]|uniref:Stress-response A/B barrel domain-containing protein n=1 Tax=Deinococcus cellulosilyticus (strain DSM 18568 / NBRC 106333 / KACC 11606 / 5516J-15) TaxID=1223518 RepID=A0A511N1J6_DEIC1|nr:Dabb family protein [Deinococcus cellulosilyticus]GEM46744.1 hypothetical protein DC3_23790 [Deinococcus cellulosilyticus NBRC 106333 = KACC 11606]